MVYLFISALVVATASAVRGVWSPCGLSMLSSITPMTEAGRGNRFRTTAAWFLLGGVAGGLTLGATAAAAGALVTLADPSDALRYGVVAVAAAITAGIDMGAFGVELPIFKRQVNDAWLRRYRSWVYGAGFGWQIGVGVATYIMTAGVFLTFAAAVMIGSPLAALAVGLVFGLVRGSAVYIGRNATSPEALRLVHDRLDQLAPLSRAAAAWAQVGAGAVAATLAWGGAAAALLVGGAVILAVTKRIPRRATATA